MKAQAGPYSPGTHVPYGLVTGWDAEAGYALDVGQEEACSAGLAVFTWSATFGWAVAPVDCCAHASCWLKQGLVLLASPPFTPTMANAWPTGRAWLH
jgi:hypothetical protein